MSEIIIGSRNKERFAMYLALAAAVSLWIVPVDFFNVNLLNISESGVLSFASSSILIAIVLYESQVDKLLDRRIKKKAQEVKWTNYLSPEAIAKCEEYTPDINSAIEDPIVRLTLEDSKNGITTGCAIIIGSTRYLISGDVILPIFGLAGGLIILCVTLVKEDLKELPTRVKALAWFRIFQYMLNRKIVLSDRALKNVSSLSSFERDEGHRPDQEIIVSARSRRESLNGLIEQFQVVEKIFQERRWFLFHRSLLHLINDFVEFG